MGLWPLDHDVVLFAWLDFCNQHKIDYLATIERELKEKTKISRSRAAVCTHLCYTEWRYRKPNEKRRIQHDELVPHIGIIETGSQGLRYPPKEMTPKIRKALREYEKEYSPDRIQKLTKVTSKNKPGQLKVQPPPRSSPPVKKPEYSSSNVRKRVSPPEDGEYSNKKRCVEQVRVFLVHLIQNVNSSYQQFDSTDNFSRNRTPSQLHLKSSEESLNFKSLSLRPH